MKRVLRMGVVLAMMSLSHLPVLAQSPDEGVLTIDSALQSLAERLLQGKQGSIVALDPMTGEIRCMASRSEVADGLNRAIGKAYSPGSTFKVAQALAMLSDSTLTVDTAYTCKEGFWKDGIHIGCHAHKSPLSLVSAIAHSCNSYFCKAFTDYVDNKTVFASRHQALHVWGQRMHSLGFGHALGVDLPGEVGGVAPDDRELDSLHNARWNSSTIMWMGMGQGEVHCTPLQLCNLAAAIANRGQWYTPHIHRYAADNPLAERFHILHEVKAAPACYDILYKGMRGAVQYGTCAGINTSMYHICGKTGTAENAGEDHSIFIGFAPMENPQVAVAVYIEHGGFGADVAAPIASLIFEQAINHKLGYRSKRYADEWADCKIPIASKKGKREIPVTFDEF